MKITCWMNLLTPHWQQTLTRLAALAGEAIDVYADTPGNDADRAQFGWTNEVLAAANVVVHLKPDISLLRDRDWRGSVHLVCNPFNNKTNRKMLNVFDRQGVSYGFQQSLPGLISGPIGRLARNLAYRTVFLPALKRARFILCHGEFCRNYLTKVGVPTARLLDSGYFVQPDPHLLSQIASRPPAADAARFVFLGQFIERKQVIPLTQALRTSGPNQPWTLDFIGTGAQRDELAGLIWRVGVRVLPPIGYADVVPTLSRYDCLVLPSRADEWAVVINEAIHAGCAVICTDQCGGADLVRHGACGVVVGDAASCAQAMTDLAGDLPRLNRYRDAARQLSPRIDSTHGAHYLWSVIQHATGHGPRPVPPWITP